MVIRILSGAVRLSWTLWTSDWRRMVRLRRAMRIAAACLCLRGEVTPPPPTVVVYWPSDTAVRWEYAGIASVAYHETREEALRMYAVMARVMVERR